ncbi:hypothetical protein D3C73_1050050 [compost metagenome]
MPVTQQIIPGHRVTTFAVKAEKTAQTAFGPMMTVSCVDLWQRPHRINQLQNGALLIGGQQLALEGVVLARLHGEQLLAVLKYRMTGLSLPFRYQMLMTIEALHAGLVGALEPCDLVQRVIVIPTHRGRYSCHRGSLLVEGQSCTHT